MNTASDTYHQIVSKYILCAYIPIAKARGFTPLFGKSGPNCDRASLETISTRMHERGITTEMVVDASHANSKKQHEKQIEVVHDIGATLEAVKLPVAGIMIESHLEAGRQDLKPGTPLKYGQSITDACLGWTEIEALLDHLAHLKRK